MNAQTTTIYWTARNNSSFLNGFRRAPNILAAVRDARHYLRNELYGEGEIVYYESNPALADWDNPGHPCRIDERTIFTRFRWETRQPW
jgi:hypothetical protein